MALTLADGGNALDLERAAALRRMRSLAVGLLLFAATVFLLTIDRHGVWGFVNAGAEASMVGAIADWFAVVALFKHPLGIPVPHTALIPRRKDMLGKGLEEFVGENFLHADIIRPRILDAEPAAKAAAWLGVESHARRVVLEGADLLGLAVKRIEDQDVADFINSVLVPRFVAEPISPIVGSLLSEIVDDGAHQGFVDLIVEETERWLAGNEGVFYDVVVERAPRWVPDAVNDVVIRRLHAEMVHWLQEIRREPAHRSRLALDKLLRELAHDLLTDPVVGRRMEGLKERFLAHPQVSVTYISLWNALRRALVAALEDPEGELVQRGVREVQGFALRLGTDEAFRARMDAQVSNIAVFLIERYGGELTSVITNTIEQWDGQEASRRIELHVGKDLQFIRINGTLVGGLVGVLIHTLTVIVT